MIVSEPFAVAYGLDALLHTMIIDIGAGTTDFCVMKGRYPTEEDQRTLTVAGDSIDAQLLKLIEERYPQANVTVLMVREWKEKYSFVGDAPKTRARHRAGQRRADGARHHQRDAAACETLARADGRDDARPALARRAGVPGARAQQHHPLRRRRPDPQPAAALEDALKQVGGGKVTHMQDPVFVGSDGGLALALDAPDSDWEKLSA